jgi:hypothetical protein
MTTTDFIIELFCRVDEQMQDVSKHPQAKLFPGEVVTLALLFALKGTTLRNFYRWLKRDYLPLFPNLPDRTRLARLFKTHQQWAARFLAEPTLLGVTDSFGIEFCHPVRELRFPQRQRIGKKGKSNSRWIFGGKLCVVLNKWGAVPAWQAATANVSDSEFHPLLKEFAGRMIIFADTGFHSKSGDPENVKICERGTWNVRMVVESVFSLLTRVCHSKRMTHRVWEYFEMRLGFLIAVFNVLLQWRGIQVDENGVFHLSLAEFSL